MNPWQSYQQRVCFDEGKEQAYHIQREQGRLKRNLTSHLSTESVTVNGTSREVSVISSDDVTQKTICAVEGERLFAGSLVMWNDMPWLISSVDPNHKLYSKGTMLHCNHLLKWMNDKGEVVKRWSVISDGTKYMVGETSSAYAGNGMVLGDTRISVVVPRDKETAKLTREHRFIIDDEHSPNKLTYRLTKPFKVGGVFDGRGVISFIFTEVNMEADDNAELGIADYYKYVPKRGKPPHKPKEEPDFEDSLEESEKRPEKPERKETGGWL